MSTILSRLAWLLLGGYLTCPLVAPDGWSERSPRDEIRPAFSYRPEGGPDRRGSFVIEADGREGLFGWWEKTVPVRGGTFYEFTARRRVEKVETPRRTTVARVLWRDDKGRPVLRDEPSRAGLHEGDRPRAEPEYPADRGEDPNGWTEVGGVFQAPSGGHAGGHRAVLSMGAGRARRVVRRRVRGDLAPPAPPRPPGHHPPPAA